MLIICTLKKHVFENMPLLNTFSRNFTPQGPTLTPLPNDRRKGLVRCPKSTHPKNPVGKFFSTSLSGTDVRVWWGTRKTHSIECTPTLKVNAAKVRCNTKGRTHFESKSLEILKKRKKHFFSQNKKKNKIIFLLKNYSNSLRNGVKLDPSTYGKSPICKDWTLYAPQHVPIFLSRLVL